MPEWVLPVLALSFTILTFVGGLGYSQANRSNSLRESILDKLGAVESNILKKLEYHERHDDQRFSDVKNDIWMLRLRAASNSGLLTEEEESLNNARQERRNSISGGVKL